MRRVAWSQGETQVLELGAGPPLLLVHGGGDAAFEWVPILEDLARRHRVLAVDRPGHGLADPFDYDGVDVLEHAVVFLREILDALELDTVDIAGNSLGGLWSVAFALEHPERVSRLALVGAPPGVTRLGAGDAPGVRPAARRATACTAPAVRTDARRAASSGAGSSSRVPSVWTTCSSTQTWRTCGGTPNPSSE